MAETGAAYDVLPVNVLATDVDPRFAQVFRKPEASPALAAAFETRTGGIFMDFARFPWAQVEAIDSGFDVQIRDLRFATASAAGGFLAQIELDKNLVVRSESFTFRGR